MPSTLRHKLHLPASPAHSSLSECCPSHTGSVFQSVLVYSRCPCSLSLSGSFGHPSPFALSASLAVPILHGDCAAPGMPKLTSLPTLTAEGLGLIWCLGHRQLSLQHYTVDTLLKTYFYYFQLCSCMYLLLCGYVHTGKDVYRGQRHLILPELESEPVVKPNSILCKSRKRL